MSSDVIVRPSPKDLLVLAWPIVVSRSAQVVVGLTDAIMVGVLGEAALAATTAGATNTWTVLILPFGTVSIIASFASQLHGKGDGAGVRRFGWYGLVIAAIAQVLSFLSFPVIDDAVGALPYAADVQAMMTSYLRLRLLGGGFAIGIEALANAYGAVGNTRLPMFANVVAMVVNVALNWVLITGNLGAPALGVDGAAIASAVASAAGFALLFGCFLTGRGLPPAERTPLRRAELWRTFRYGLPAGFNWFIEFAAFAFFMNVVLAGLGTTAVAAMMAVLQLNTVAFMPAFALASAGAIFVGQALGARQPDHAPRTVKLTLGVAAVWMVVVGIAYLAAPRVFLSFFVEDVTQAEAFLALGATILMLSTAWQLFDATSMTVAEALRAAGDTTFTFWARAVIAWFIFVPSVWISVRVFGMEAVGATMWLVVYLALLATTLALRFRSGRWRNIGLTETEVPPLA